MTKQDIAIAGYIKAKLVGNDAWATRALVRIYAFQTAQEQSAGLTVEENGIGFNGTDAEILSSFAQQFNRRNWLSGKQMEILRRKIQKYWRQVWELIPAEKQATILDEIAKVESIEVDSQAAYDAEHAPKNDFDKR
jgi:hypothetical protein